MPRVNLCTNPHADVDTSGWTSNGALTRVTGTGFPKANVVEANVAVGLIWTAQGAVTPGTEYTISAQIKNTAAAGNANPFIEWRDSGGSALSYSAGTSTNCPTNVVTAVSATGTAPANAAFAAMLVGNMAGVRQMAAVLIEPAATPSAYADGDSSGWVWDGTTGLSSSTQLPPTVTGTATASLGALSAAAVGVRKAFGTAVATLGGLTATATGLGSPPPPPPAPVGSWYTLLAVSREAADPSFRRAGLLVACPNDGEPLSTGPRGELYCRFDGWRPQ